MVYLRLYFSLVALFELTQSTSTIATFTDSKCKDSFRDFSGPNGYPNGTCKSLDNNGPYQSFQVVNLDPECTVTIYAQDQSGDICSSTAAQIEANIAKCYSTAWVYYSIDGCADPDSSSSSSPTSSPSSTRKPKRSVGPIVGGVIGGVVGVALILASAVYFWRTKRSSAVVPTERDSIYEMSGAEERKEMPGHEAYGGYFRGEMEGEKAPSVKASPAPVELPTDHH